MIRWFGIGTIVVAAAIASSAVAQMPISPVYRTTPEQKQPTADKSAPAVKERAPTKAASRDGENASRAKPASVEQEPVATAPIPPLPRPDADKEGATEATPSPATERAERQSPAATPETPPASPPRAQAGREAAASQGRPNQATTRAARRHAQAKRQVRQQRSAYRPPIYYDTRSPRWYADPSRGYGSGMHGPSPYSEGP